jgi:hypothetical protein
MKVPSGLLLMALIAGCQAPREHWSMVAPGGGHWVAVESVPPAPGSDDLEPTIRLRLMSRWRSQGPVLLEGVPSLCGTTVQWPDDGHLTLRVPADRADGLRFSDGDAWAGIRVAIQVHEDQVVLQRPSPDGRLRLVVIKGCESEDWNLYLRRDGDPNYLPAMRLGWDDPDLFGGLGPDQPVISLTWTGPRRARIVVPGKPYGVTLKHDLGGVHVDWAFNVHYHQPPAALQTLAPLPSPTP